MNPDLQQPASNTTQPTEPAPSPVPPIITPPPSPPPQEEPLPQPQPPVEAPPQVMSSEPAYQPSQPAPAPTPTPITSAVPAAPSTPQLEGKAKLRHHKIGLPKKVRVVGYADHIEIYDKKGTALLNSPLNQVQELKFMSTYFTFTASGQFYSLDFRSSISGMLGMLGYYLLGFKAKKLIKQWKVLFQQAGVVTG